MDWHKRFAMLRHLVNRMSYDTLWDAELWDVLLSGYRHDSEAYQAQWLPYLSSFLESCRHTPLFIVEGGVEAFKEALCVAPFARIHMRLTDSNVEEFFRAEGLGQVEVLDLSQFPHDDYFARQSLRRSFAESWCLPGLRVLDFSHWDLLGFPEVVGQAGFMRGLEGLILRHCTGDEERHPPQWFSEMPELKFLDVSASHVMPWSETDPEFDRHRYTFRALKEVKFGAHVFRSPRFASNTWEGLRESPLESVSAPDLRFDAEAILAMSSLKHIEKLRHLDLSGNPLGDEGVLALLELERLENLVSLNLERCNLTDAGAIWLSASSRLRHLEVLKIREGNLIHEDGVFNLATSGEFSEGLRQEWEAVFLSEYTG